MLKPSFGVAFLISGIKSVSGGFVYNASKFALEGWAEENKGEAKTSPL